MNEGNGVVSIDVELTEQGERITGNLEPVDGLCNARNRFGRFCPKDPMIGRNRCYFHGGKSLRGMESPLLKHGRYSRALKTLGPGYEEAKNDPELLALSDEVALVDARLKELLSRCDSGESGALWKELHQLWKGFTRARIKGDRDQMTELLELLGENLMRGQSDHAAWLEIGALIDRRQRLVESERKRLIELEQTLSVDDAKLLLRRVLDAVQRHVTDPKTLAKIGADLGRLATVDAVPVALTSGRARSNRRRRSG